MTYPAFFIAQTWNWLRPSAFAAIGLGEGSKKNGGRMDVFHARCHNSFCLSFDFTGFPRPKQRKSKNI
jgi:hypothetical protein